MNSRRFFLRSVALATAVAVLPFLREKPPSFVDTPEPQDGVSEVSFTMTTSMINAKATKLNMEWTVEECDVEMYHGITDEV